MRCTNNANSNRSPARFGSVSSYLSNILAMQWRVPTKILTHCIFLLQFIGVMSLEQNFNSKEPTLAGVIVRTIKSYTNPVSEHISVNA